MLFSNQRKHALSLPAKDENGKRIDMAFLVDYLCRYLMKDRRKEMFVLDGAMYATTSSTVGSSRNPRANSWTVDREFWS